MVERGRKRGGASICWFSFHLATTAGPGSMQQASSIILVSDMDEVTPVLGPLLSLMHLPEAAQKHSS